MNRDDAIDRANERYPTAALNSDNTRFANINAAKDVWWIDVPLGMVEHNLGNYINLLAYDHRTDDLGYLRVPTTYFREHLRDLVVHHDQAKIRLELSANSRNLFQDVRPTGGGVTFGQFLQR